MPLSEYEQRVLAQMERQLSSDDPKLAQSLSSAPRRTSRVLLGSVVVAAGLAVLLLGLTQGLSWLGIIGFLVMFGGVLLALSHGKAVPGGDAPAAGTPGKPTPQKSAFMSRLDERWDKRRDQGR